MANRLDHPMMQAFIRSGVRADLKEDLERHLNGTPKPRSNAPVVATDDPAAARWCEAGVKAVCDELSRVQGGSRNDATYKCSFRVGTFVAGGYLDETRAWHAVYDAASVNAHLPGHDGQPFTPAEIERVIENGFRDARSEPAVLHLDPDYGDIRPAFTLPDVLINDEESRFVAGGTFVLDAPSTPEAVWGEGNEVFWASGESTIFVGPPGVGKTTLAQQVALARCGLTPTLLDMPVTVTGSKVLYLAMDRPRQIARSMRRMVTEGDRELLDERLVVWKGPPPHDIAKRPSVLVELAHEAGADTIIVDSVKDAAINLVDSEVAGNYNRARQAALAAGIEILEIAHPRKGGGERKSNKSIDDVHGGMEISAGAGSLIALEGEPGDLVVKLVHRKQPAEMLGPMQLAHDHEGGKTVVYKKITALDILRDNPEGMLSASDVARHLYEVEKPSDSERERARKQLEKLVAASHARKVPGALKTQEDRYKAISAPATTFDWMS